MHFFHNVLYEMLGMDISMKDFNGIYKEGKEFENRKHTHERKKNGIFYTPQVIVEQMVESALSHIDISINPYIRIFDPSCGAGFFLIKCIECLEKKLLNCLPELRKNHSELEKLNEDSLRVFIAENNIWGADIDPEAVNHTEQAIISMVGKTCKTNVFCCDSLADGYTELSDFKLPGVSESSLLWSQQYDVIIGNPPYLGHKAVDGAYKKQLQALYPGVYKDKSDISYCFIKRSIDMLKKDGVLSFITSRYFMEGPSADGLRRYITENGKVHEIIDYNGYKIFEDAGVAACIITVHRNFDSKGTAVRKLEKWEGIKAIGNSDMEFSSFVLDSSMLLPEGWRLISPEYNEIFQIIEMKGSHTLEQIFDSYQGIITGCDKAFVVDDAAAKANGLERDLLKPWIKNSNVMKHRINSNNSLIIYSDLIQNPEEYPNALKYIERHKERLLQRRECRNGIREWYKLQWGRKHEIFEGKKLVYPYKAAKSRFAVDLDGYYCSADIYSLVLKDEYKKEIDYEYAAAVLNSSAFEFYFMCFAKKISGNLYDYYPNTVLRMKIDLNELSSELVLLSRKINKCKNEDERNCILKCIDREIYSMYGLNQRHIELIEQKGCD